MELTLDQALQKGIEAHKAGNVQEADRYYTAILKANPKHPDANHNMGILAVGVGKVEVALPFFKKALEINPKILQFWLSYIDALIKEKHFDDANKVIEKGTNKNLNIVDLTGAGDLFAAGYLHGYLNNLTDEASLEKGTELASKIIQQVGARF